MKKTLSLLLTFALTVSVLLTGCNGSENTESTTSPTVKQQDLQKVMVGVIDDKSAISMTNFLDMNAEGKLSGKYTVKMYPDVLSAKEALKKGEIQVCSMPVFDAITLSSDNSYIYRIGALNKCYDYALYTKGETSLSALNGKEILAYGNNCAEFVKAILATANVTADITLYTEDDTISQSQPEYAAIACEIAEEGNVTANSAYNTRISLSEQNAALKTFKNMYTSATLVNYDFSMVNDQALATALTELKTSFTLPDETDYLCEVAVSRSLATDTANAKTVLSTLGKDFTERKDLQSDISPLLSALSITVATPEKLTLK